MDNSPPSTRRIAATALARAGCAIHELALRGSGCDRTVLREHGSDKCLLKAAAAGYMNLAASTLGAVGAAAKAAASIEGLSGLAAGGLIGLLYWTAVWNGERTLAAQVDPFWGTRTKLKALVGRALVSTIMAAFQAIPWTLIVLEPDIPARLQRFELEERKESQAALEQLHNVRALATKTTQLAEAASHAANQVWVLPESIIDAKQLVARCDQNAEALLAANRRKASALQAKLPNLANVELSTTATQAQKSAARTERQAIQTRINRLADEVAAKRQECKTVHAQAEDAQRRYVADATARAERARAVHDSQRHTLTAVEQQLKREGEKASAVVQKANSPRGGGQIKGALALLREDLRAQVVRLAIFLWFFILDLSTASLKLMGSPGDYDQEIRMRQELKRRSVEARIRTAADDEEFRAYERAAKKEALKRYWDAGGVDALLAAHQRRRHDAIDERELGAANLDIVLAQIGKLEELAERARRARERVKDSPVLLAQLDGLLEGLIKPHMQPQTKHAISEL